MAENITINVQQDNDIVNIVSSQVTEVIDINVAETTEEVTLNITEEIIQVNINKVTNSTSTPSLQDVTDVGNHTTNDIYVENNEYYSIVEPYDVGTSNINSGAYTYISGDGAVGIRTNNSEGTIKTTNLSEVLTLEFPDKTGIKTIATTEDIPNITTLVPYTGATLDVDLGEKELNTGKLWLYDAVSGGDEKGSLHYADEALYFENSDGETLMYIEPGFMQLHKTGAIQSNLFTTNLTQNRDHYLPDNSGTIALTSDITGTNSGTNTGDETITSIKTKLGITTLSGSNTGDQDLSGKVDKIIGKGLSTNDYTTTEQTKVSNLSGTNSGDETATSIKSKLGITTLSGSNTGDQDLTNLVVKNSAITGATKTKITYDAKGLVTSGSDATTADIADSTNKRYVTDANLTTIGNQSGTNTGDETTSTIKTKLGITTLSGSNTGDQDLSGYTPTTRTINTYPLSSNITLTTADVADSTGKRYQTENQKSFNDATSSIQTQLNGKQASLIYNPYRYLNTTQSTTTGTLTETVVATATITGGTFNANDIMKMLFQANKGTTTSNVTLRIKIGSTSTFASATTIATYTFTLASGFVTMQRNFSLAGGNINTAAPTSTLLTDIFATSASLTAITANPANTLYVFFSVQLGTSLDSVTFTMANISN
jgi:hypothetical protein